MVTHCKNKIIFLLFFFLFIFSKEVMTKDNIWKVLVTGLPERIEISMARGNINYYILKQTHEQLFKIQ